MKKLLYIDTMRGIAILLVISCHCAYYVYLFISKESRLVNFFTRGQIGVQLFFVSSALTLCLSAEKRKEIDQNHINFFLRRFFRIMPMYYLGIIIYLLINFYFQNRYDPNLIRYYTFNGVLSNLLLIHGFIPKYNNTIVPGGWSIGTEVIFYVCFPFLFSKIQFKSFRAVTLILLIYMLAAFLLLSVYKIIFNKLCLFNNSFYYYNILNQGPVFLWGFLLYKQIKYSVIKNNFYLLLLMASGFSLFYFFWLMEVKFYAAFFLVPFFAGMAMFGFGSFLHHYNTNIKIISHIGRLSYSMYIFHFIFTHYFFPYFYERQLVGYLTDPLAICLLCFVVTIIPTYLFALLTSRYIEQPFINLGGKIITRLTNDK